MLPCGGYANVIGLAHEVIKNNLLSKTSSICIILDGDVEKEVANFQQSRNIANNIPTNFLPIESLEKYLKRNLYDVVDHALFRKLNNYIFHQKSLDEIIGIYKKEHLPEKDKAGKVLYQLLDEELRSRGKSRNEIVNIVMEYLFDNDRTRLKRITEFLHKQLK